MKILIVGGTAFIGYYVVRELLQDIEHEIVLFNRGNRKEDIPEGVGLIVGDRNNITDFREEFEKFAPDLVLHMVPFGDKDAKKFMEAISGIPKRVVAISSCDVYRAYGKLIGNEPGEPDPLPLTEESPLREKFYPYRDKEERMADYDKILAEREIMGDPDIPGTILRLPIVYGPRDYQHRLYSYIKRMDDNRPAILLDENHANWRIARGYVEDMAYAIYLAMTNEKAAGEIYNVAEETCFPEKKWIKTIGEVLDWDGEVVEVPSGTFPMDHFHAEHHLVVDSSKIRKQLGYEEKFPREERLRRAIEWERENPPKGFSVDYQKEDELLEKLK